MRKIIDENTRMCDLDPAQLADHYFNAPEPECDLSIFDNWESTASELNIDKFTTGKI